jgi:hypothetical protein
MRRMTEQRKMEGMEKMAGAAEKGSKAMQNLKMVPNDNPEEQGVPA